MSELMFSWCVSTSFWAKLWHYNIDYFRALDKTIWKMWMNEYMEWALRFRWISIFWKQRDSIPFSLLPWLFIFQIVAMTVDGKFDIKNYRKIRHQIIGKFDPSPNLRKSETENSTPGSGWKNRNQWSKLIRITNRQK